MVGMLGCGCCDTTTTPTYCAGKQSTTGDLIDSFNPPFSNKPLPPGDTGPGSIMSQTYEGWRRWKEYGSSYLPWTLQPSKQFHAGLKLYNPGAFLFVPPEYWLSEDDGFPPYSDELLYSFDFLKAKYYIQVDVNLDFQYAPIVQFLGNGFYQSAFVSPEFSFAGLFFEHPYFHSGYWGAWFCPTLRIFMRRQNYDISSGGSGSWSHYYWIQDDYRYSFFSSAQTITKLDATNPIKRLGCLVECINLEQKFSSNPPILKYTLDIDGQIVYSANYTLYDRYATMYGGVYDWRPNGYCRCVIAGHIGLKGFTRLQGIEYGRSSFGGGGNRQNAWLQNVQQHYWADNFSLDERPL